MKSSLILALLAVSFVLALSSPSELIFRDRMKQFHEKMVNHLSEQQEPRQNHQSSHEMPAWKAKRMNIHHADYDPTEETERSHHRGHDNFKRNRFGGEDRYNSYERRSHYQPAEYNTYPSFSGRRWFSPNAEMHNNRFSRFNSPLNQNDSHHRESLEEKIERMEKKLNELKRTQKYQEALERVMERLARKKAEKGSQ